MNKRGGIISRGQLLRAIAACDSETDTLDPKLIHAIGVSLGWDVRPPQPKSKQERSTFGTVNVQDVFRSEEGVPAIAGNSRLSQTGRWPQHAVPTLFWMPTGYVAEQQLVTTVESPRQSRLGWSAMPQAAAHPDLLPWKLISQRLRSMLIPVPRPGEVDVDRTVERLSWNLPEQKLVYRRWRRWGRSVVVLVDRSRHLMPFFHDQRRLLVALQTLLGSTDLQAYFGDGPDLLTYWHFGTLDDPVVEFRQPGDTARILLLSDLGSLSDDNGHSVRAWADSLSLLNRNGCRLMALVPNSLQRVDAEILKMLDVRGWGVVEGWSCSELTRFTRIRRVQILLSICVRVEPGLLRMTGRLLWGSSEPRLESEVWQSEIFSRVTSEAAEVAHSDFVEQLRGEFDGLPVLLRQSFLQLLRTWRTKVGCELYFEELSRLSTASRGLVEKEDWTAALEGWSFLRQRVLASTVDSQDPVVRYASEVLARVSGTTLVNSEIGRIAIEMRNHLAGAESAVPSGGFECLTVFQEGATLRVCADNITGAAVKAGRSPLIQLRTSNGVVRIRGDRESEHTVIPGDSRTAQIRLRQWSTIELKSDLECVRLQRVTRPVWAINFARDAYGLFADTVLSGVRTRWRWIPPGSFRMGSPKGEAGRFSGEGPQHWVTLTKGFWMMDVPCTQELWQAVMQGKNPSRFKDDQRPVENVSWKDAQKFIQKLNKLAPGPELRLPTEAQWEYACRAGSETALYRIPGTTGELTILGALHGPELDAIAWYGGNIGVDPKFPNAADSKSWSQKQYDHSHAATQPVRLKKANMWGLYDMLGNIWEWCADSQRPYNSEPQVDPVGQSVGSRAIRGGSWGSHARNVRCAYRNQDPPGRQRSTLGFRLVRVQEGS